jgi:hypothetical protein
VTFDPDFSQDTEFDSDFSQDIEVFMSRRKKK